MKYVDKLVLKLRAGKVFRDLPWRTQRNGSLIFNLLMIAVKFVKPDHSCK